MNYIICLLLVPSIVYANVNDYWQQCVDYEMHVNLDTRDHIVSGFERIEYTNNSPDTLHQLYFHLYPNAYCDSSVMASEARKAGVSLIKKKGDGGSLTLHNVRLIYPDGQQFHNVQMNYGADATIMQLRLSQVLYPNQTMTVQMDFVTKLWRWQANVLKGGYTESSYIISQWYPKICVYDEDGWNTEPYHWLGEFYGEFGSFNVTITTPYELVVAATGVVMSGDPGWDAVQLDSVVSFAEIEKIMRKAKTTLQADPYKKARRVVTFSAENVHDFMWIASREFVYCYQQIGNVPVHFLFQGWKRLPNEYDTIRESVRTALNWLEDHVGPYPYPALNIIVWPLGENMEYPMIALIGRINSLTITHEILHTYFYGALANNEIDEPWLDEALVTYLAEHITGYMKNLVPNKPLISNPVSTVLMKDIRLNYLYYYLTSNANVPLGTHSYNIPDRISYNLTYYVKGSAFFRYLAHVVGPEKFEQILRTYYNELKFRHVNRERFLTICNRISNMELSSIFEQFLDSSPEVDYAISGLTYSHLKNGNWKANVCVKRNGEAKLPVDVELLTEDGSRYLQQWCGEGKKKSVVFQTMSKPQRAVVDPDEVAMDVKYYNNSSGPPKLKWMIFPEMPNYYYQPRDRYLISCWPRVWFNDIDGTTMGMRWQGGYLNRYHITRGQLWYGARSHTLDGSIAITEPVKSKSIETWLNLIYKRLDGRELAEFNMLKQVRASLFRPPFFQFRAGVVGYHLFDARYVRENNGIQYWDDGTIFKYYANGEAMFKWLQWKHTVDARVELADNHWMGDYSFAKALFSHNSVYSITKAWDFGIHTFIGSCVSENMPTQEMFGVSGAGIFGRWSHAAARSVGGQPPWLHYHVAGDANVRGFVERPGEQVILSKQVASIGWEYCFRFVQRKMPLLTTIFRKTELNIDVQLFNNAALANSTSFGKATFVDAGFGIVLRRRILGKDRELLFQFPVWINHPEFIDSHESDFQFRWLIQFKELL